MQNKNRSVLNKIHKKSISQQSTIVYVVQVLLLRTEKEPLHSCNSSLLKKIFMGADPINFCLDSV